MIQRSNNPVLQPSLPTLMDLTIVIVNWNGGDLLMRCLQTIRASRTSFAVKVIMVDNDSSDGSREQAQRDFPEFQIFNSGGNLGFGRANNLARPMVDTPLVLFLNPDTELKEDTLEKCVQCLIERSDVGALGCKMLYPTGEIQEQGLQWFPTPLTVLAELLLANRVCRRYFRRWLPTIDPAKSAYIQKLYGGFVLAHKKVLDRAGWFDDRYFMYAEDVDLSRTITSLGWKLYYTNEAEVIHVCGGTSEKAPSGFSVLMKHESIAKFMRKYHGRTGLFFYRVAIFTGAAFRWIALLPKRLFSYFKSGETHRLQGSILKQKLMVLWALGIRKPVFAQTRPATSFPPVQDSPVGVQP